MVVVTRFTGALPVPLNEIPKYLNPETRKLVESALEDAWRELTGGAPAGSASAQGAPASGALAQGDLAGSDPARRKMAGTIVALAAVGETDPVKLRRFALNAVKGLRKGR